MRFVWDDMLTGGQRMMDDKEGAFEGRGDQAVAPVADSGTVGALLHTHLIAPLNTLYLT